MKHSSVFSPISPSGCVVPFFKLGGALRSDECVDDRPAYIKYIHVIHAIHCSQTTTGPPEGHAA